MNIVWTVGDLFNFALWAFMAVGLITMFAFLLINEWWEERK